MKFARTFIYLVLGLGTVTCTCPAVVRQPLGFIVEHAVWRGWQQMIIFSSALEQDCSWALVRLIKCLGINGIASAINVNVKTKVDATSGILIFAPTHGHARNTSESFINTIKQITAWQMNTGSYDWLIMGRSMADFKIISDTLNATAGRFDQNIVAALPDIKRLSNIDLCNHNFIYKKDLLQNRKFKYKNHSRLIHCHQNSIPSYNCNKNGGEVNYFRTSPRFQNITKYQKYEVFDKMIPIWRSGILQYNFSMTFQPQNISQFSLKTTIRNWQNVHNLIADFKVHLLQFFKVRHNSTLFVSYLGAWRKERSMSLVQPPYPVEARNFMGDKFIFGRCNASIEATVSLDDNGEISSEVFDDVLSFLALRLNATPVTRYYGKLGFRTYEGAWTGLLGALMDQSVDIALEAVTAVSSRHKDMDFIFPIAKTMCNIYIRHQETSAVRDIFLAPFNPRLIACVICIALMASMAIYLISRTKFHNGSRYMSYTEALVWSTGILCQQGGSWTPPNPAASLLLIVCLIFALITYNAYAAFITSVLSVRVSSVGSLADVLQSSQLKIGYVKNGADQMYLMSTKDVQLNAFYIRGYSEAENLVSTTEEGLVRAALQDYAFFSGQRIARTTLRSLSQARGRCALRELPILSTRAQLAFPLLSGSPYARSVLVSLLQLRSGGALERLEAALVPGMPQCSPPSDFASARAADVKTALFVIFSGFILASCVGNHIRQQSPGYYLSSHEFSVKRKILFFPIGILAVVAKCFLTFSK